MTDNKDALSADDIKSASRAFLDAIDITGKFENADGVKYQLFSAKQVRTITAILRQSLTASPSAGVDVSKILGHVEAALRLQNAMINNRISDDLAVQAKIELGSAIKALQTLPDAQGWRDEVDASRNALMLIAEEQDGELQTKICAVIDRLWVLLHPNDKPQPAKDKTK